MNLKAKVLLSAILSLSFFYAADTSSAQSSRVFVGCWTQFPAGTCRAIYRDSNNNYYICGKCDASGNPGGGKCSQISQRTLDQGYWCS